MGKSLRKLFRKEVANLLDCLDVSKGKTSADFGVRNISQTSSSNIHSSSSSNETYVTSSKRHKKSKKGKRKKIRDMEVLDLMAQASDIAVQVRKKIFTSGNT